MVLDETTLAVLLLASLSINQSIIGRLFGARIEGGLVIVTSCAFLCCCFRSNPYSTVWPDRHGRSSCARRLLLGILLSWSAQTALELSSSSFWRGGVLLLPTPTIIGSRLFTHSTRRNDDDDDDTFQGKEKPTLREGYSWKRRSQTFGRGDSGNKYPESPRQPIPTQSSVCSVFYGLLVVASSSH
jgi:hypothetical protein